MSTFEVKTYVLKIEPHNNADTLELAVVGDYRSIVRKGQFKTGDVGVYIPEGAVLPEWLIEDLGLVGKLAGPNKNRVKAVKLRGVLSQGLIYPTCVYYDELAIKYIVDDKQYLDETEMPTGEGYRYASAQGDLAATLGITKYEPPIPVHMAGEVWNAHGYTPKYDIENIKKFPGVLLEGEDVIITEKLHGTWTCFGYHPDIDTPIVCSKGLSAQGLAFKFNDANAENLYVKMFESSRNGDGETIIDDVRKVLNRGNEPVYVFGEIYGPGVQDLTYGEKAPNFRVFDIYVGTPGKGAYLPGQEFCQVCHYAGVETVPVLYTGAFNKETVAQLTDGKDTVHGSNIREGVVVRPLNAERYTTELGRVILKSVSASYLTRKGDATEYT